MVFIDQTGQNQHSPVVCGLGDGITLLPRVLSFFLSLSCLYMPEPCFATEQYPVVVGGGKCVSCVCVLGEDCRLKRCCVTFLARR